MAWGEGIVPGAWVWGGAILGCFLKASVYGAAPLGLNECFQAAIKRSEEIASSREQVAQAEEGLSQARGAFFPNISGTASYLIQPTPPSSTASSFYPSNQTTVKVSIFQPIFQGLKEYAALRQRRDLVEISTENQAQSVIVTFQNIVTSYYQVLSGLQDLSDLRTEIQNNQKRLKELYAFRRLGRSRESEVLTLQSNIASLEAQLQASSGQLESAKALFAFLTGLPPDTPLYDSEKMPGVGNEANKIETLEYYRSRVEQRPDIQSLSKSVLSTEEEIAIARGGHFPTLGLQGNYYFARPGILSGVNWDLQFSLTIPIFQGGLVQSQVRQAASVNKQAILALSKARRQAQQKIESYYQLLQSDLAQFEKQKVAVDLAWKNYQAELHDYRLGLVTNLDVLQALTTSQESQRLLDRARFQVKVDYLQLQAEAALRPEVR